MSTLPPMGEEIKASQSSCPRPHCWVAEPASSVSSSCSHVGTVLRLLLAPLLSESGLENADPKLDVGVLNQGVQAKGLNMNPQRGTWSCQQEGIPAPGPRHTGQPLPGPGHLHSAKSAPGAPSSPLATWSMPTYMRGHR